MMIWEKVQTGTVIGVEFGNEAEKQCRGVERVVYLVESCIVLCVLIVLFVPLVKAFSWLTMIS
jgi:hypothetical protein